MFSRNAPVIRCWLFVVGIQCVGLFAISFSSPNKACAEFFVQTFENSQLYSVNPDTGSATSIGSMGVNHMTDLALRADGQLFGSNYNNLYSIDISTGAASLIEAFGTTSSMVGLDFGPGGLLYGVEQIGGRVFSI